MKTVICRKPGLCEKIDTPVPEVKKGEVLLKVVSLGICGTDIHALAGNQAFFTYPRILGHEVGAVVEEPGPGVDRFKKGDKVVVMPYQSCGECLPCRRGRPNCCTSLSLFGVHEDGGMQEFFCVPEKYVMAVDPALTPESMAVVEPYAVGRHAVVRSGLTKDDTVLVAGAGPIGLIIAELARLEGAKVILAETNPLRREFCKAEFGFEIVLDPLQENYREELLAASGGDFPTVILDATGVIKSMEAQLDYLAHSGVLVFVGLRTEDFSINDLEFHKRETTLLSSRVATTEDFMFVLDHMAKGEIHPEKLVTHTGAFDDAISLMETWSDPNSGVMKSVLLF